MFETKTVTRFRQQLLTFNIKNNTSNIDKDTITK